MQVQYDYEIDLQNKIGQGSFGEVYTCKRINKVDNSVQEICVKIITIKVKSDINKKSFFREKEISDLLSRSKNPNIIEIYDVLSITEKDKNEIKLMIYMELCDKQDLHQEIQVKRDFTIGEAIHIMSQIITGYHTLYYQNIVHRDLKPKNILKSKNGVFKITDFGLSRFIQKAPDETMFLTSVGTPFYVSPQILQQTRYTNKTDVFSLGIIFYQLLHQGKYPINPSTFGEFVERYRQLEQNRIQIWLNKADPKKNEIERLLNQMIVFKENDRISWPELFEHPFFKTYLHKTLDLGQIMPKQKKGLGQNQQDLQSYYQQSKLNIEGEYKQTFMYLEILLQLYFQALKLLQKFRTPQISQPLRQIENEDYQNLITSLIGYKYCVLGSCYSLFNHTLANLQQYDQKICQKLSLQKIKQFAKLRDLNFLNEKIYNEFKQDVEIEFQNIKKITQTQNNKLKSLLESQKYEHFEYLKLIVEILKKFMDLYPQRAQIHKQLSSLHENLTELLEQYK